MQELASVAEYVEGGGLLPPPGEDPLHQLPDGLPRHRRQDGRRLVGQDQPARREMGVRSAISINR
jgi:hypothetical protein